METNNIITKVKVLILMQIAYFYYHFLSFYKSDELSCHQFSFFKLRHVLLHDIDVWLGKNHETWPGLAGFTGTTLVTISQFHTKLEKKKKEKKRCQLFSLEDDINDNLKTECLLVLFQKGFNSLKRKINCLITWFSYLSHELDWSVGWENIFGLHTSTTHG